jgi:hypothetical protein
MKLSSIGNRGSDLFPFTLRNSGNAPEAKFNVTIGREYTAHALAWWQHGVGALIVDDTGRPNWKPIDLFEVVDATIPNHWEFRHGSGGVVLALIGYPALIHDPNHHDDLIERKKSAYEVFLSETGADRG